MSRAVHPVLDMSDVITATSGDLTLAVATRATNNLLRAVEGEMGHITGDGKHHPDIEDSGNGEFGRGSFHGKSYRMP